MVLVGLTGGIGAGKSAAAKAFAAEGAAVVDADEIARDVVAPGELALSRVVARFGPKVLTQDGRLERATLAQRIFTDSGARSDLEAILHPAIVEASSRRFVELAAQEYAVVVYEAALLVESGRHEEMDVLVVVVAPKEERVARLVARDGLERRQIEARLAAQMPQEDKAAVADFVVDNAGAIGALRDKVRAIWREINAKAW